MIGSLAGDRGTLVKWEMLDGIDSPPVCELQLMCGHYYLFDIDPSLSGWYEARRKIGMDMDEDDVLGPDHSVMPKFLLEHEVSVLEIALAAVSFEDCSLAVPFHWIESWWLMTVGLERWMRFIRVMTSVVSVFRIWNFRTTTCLVVCCRLCCSMMMVVPAGSYVPWLPW